MTGKIVVLNGVPRSGKSSIIRSIQALAPEPWINLGVDVLMPSLPESLRPGIGLRPGGEAPLLEPVVEQLFLALYDSLASYSRNGLNVIADVGHHHAYSVPRNILPRCAVKVVNLPAYFVGVRCPVQIIQQRRMDTGMPTDMERLLLWEQSIHSPGIYDLEVDTSLLSSDQCATKILEWAEQPTPSGAFAKLSNRTFGF